VATGRPQIDVVMGLAMPDGERCRPVNAEAITGECRGLTAVVASSTS
jgi:hypothetical protein